MKLNFSKMSGAGNDFVVIDDRKNRIKHPAQSARDLCDRRWGIGADGLILLRKSRKAAYEMKYYNADGSYGGMCGNGGRCIAKFAIMKRIAKKSHIFESVNHLYEAKEIPGSAIALTMINPLKLQLKQPVFITDKEILYNYVDTGAPHVVIDEKEIAEPLKKIAVEKIGRYIRYHEKFSPDGTNVNFIKLLGKNSIQIRTYERGVEAETLACGTGSVASAIVSSFLWNLTSPVNVLTQSGKNLKIEFDKNEQSIRNVKLIGPAVITFEGSVDV